MPGYILAPAIAQRMGILALDRFHAREGDQTLLDEFGRTPAGWARLFGRTVNQHGSPSIAGIDFDLDPVFAGRIAGFQTGMDLMAREDESGGQDRFGIFFTHTTASGETVGNTLGYLENDSGRLTLHGESLGAYWTRVEETGWYFDAVAMASWLHGSATSHRGLGADISGVALLASLEVGQPFALTEDWTIEPQGQLILQHVSLGDTEDVFSTIDYGGLTSITGRVGVRLEGDLTINDVPVQPFADINLWHDFSSSQTTVFNDRAVTTPIGGTALELGAGVSAQLAPDVSLYGAVNYTMGLDGSGNNGFGGHVGLRVAW